MLNRTMLLLAAGLVAACAPTDDPTPPPAPESIPTPRVTELRYCLGGELGESTAVVDRLITELAEAWPEDPITLVHVAALDATCAYDTDGIDVAVGSWTRGCRHASAENGPACMVRSLLVDLADLGESTVDAGDPDVVDSLRSQLDLMLELGLGTDEAPAITAAPPVEVDPTTDGCYGAQILSVTPAQPDSYQLVSIIGSYGSDVDCVDTYTWVSDIDGPLDTGSSMAAYLSPGTHTITFTITSVCPDPSDPNNPDAHVTYTCEASVVVEVAQGHLPPGSYCDRDAAEWEALEQANQVNIVNETQTSQSHLYGGPGIDLLLANDRPNKIHAADGKDCIYGYGDGDHIAGNGGPDQIFGGSGNDRIHGDGDQDRIWGDDDNDRIGGGHGSDYLVGGYGADRIHGDLDQDTIFGNDGNDKLHGNDGNDTIYGGAGDDCLRGDLDPDTIYGDDGGDNIDGGWGDDQVRGGAGNDDIGGAVGDDVIHGDSGNDRLRGNDGVDHIYGEDDDDVLCGGTGFGDGKHGGPGTDTCQSGGTNVDCEGLNPFTCPLSMFVPAC